MIFLNNIHLMFQTISIYSLDIFCAFVTFWCCCIVRCCLCQIILHQLLRTFLVFFCCKNAKNFDENLNHLLLFCTIRWIFRWIYDGYLILDESWWNKSVRFTLWKFNTSEVSWLYKLFAQSSSMISLLCLNLTFYWFPIYY